MEKTKGQSHYSLESLRKIYDKLLKAGKYHKMGSTKSYKKGGELSGKQKGMVKELLTDDIPENDVVAKKMMKNKKKKGGKCIGPKYMCGGKKKSKMESGGLYANIHAKRKSGKPMRNKGAKGAPTDQDFKNAAKTAK